MSSGAPAVSKKQLLMGLAVAFVLVTILGVVILRTANVPALVTKTHHAIDAGLAAIRGAGPWVFFLSMAILPAFGAPLMAFTIPAGEVFAAQMTMGGVIAATLTAIAANMALSYYLARYALRPILSKIIARWGYSVPKVTGSNALTAILVLRLTPGPPFFLQSYLLGLAEAPFKLYMIASWFSMIPMVVGAVILGKGIFSGNVKVALTGLGVLVVAIALIHWVRGKYFSRAK